MSDARGVSWFVVTTDDRCFSLSVRPPGRPSWQAVIPWDSVVRVCFKAEDFLVSDALFVFTSLRPESWVIPTEANGGLPFLNELIRRRLFDAELAIQAATAHEGLFCWPPPDQPGAAG